jgi:hypothetical protein
VHDLRPGLGTAAGHTWWLATVLVWACSCVLVLAARLVLGIIWALLALAFLTTPRQHDAALILAADDALSARSRRRARRA